MDSLTCSQSIAADSPARAGIDLSTPIAQYRNASKAFSVPQQLGGGACPASLHRPRRARQQDGGLRQQAVAARRKPLITLDSPANGNLVELGLVVAKAGSDGMLLSRSTKRLTDRISIMKGDETFFLLFPMQVSRV